MAVLVDPPRWPAHGRLWSHLVSDTSLAELHAVAERAGVPARGFSGDHYDVPAEMLEAVVAAGAQPVAARELLSRLQASGLRVPKRRGETVLGSWTVPDGPGAVDLLASSLPVPDGAATGGWLVLRDAQGRVLLTGADPGGGGGAAPGCLGLPGGHAAPGEAATVAALRGLAAAGGPRLGPAAAAPCGYLRVRPAARHAAGTSGWRWSPYFTARLAGAGEGFAGVDLAWVPGERLPPTAVTSDTATAGPPPAPQPWSLVRHVLGAAGRRA